MTSGSESREAPSPCVCAKDVILGILIVVVMVVAFVASLIVLPLTYFAPTLKNSATAQILQIVFWTLAVISFGLLIGLGKHYLEMRKIYGKSFLRYLASWSTNNP